MKTRLFIAGLIALFSAAVYPTAEQFANAERGCSDNVFGGEEILFIFGLFAALMIIAGGLNAEAEKKRNDNPNVTVSQTEIEEKSESNSL